MITRLFVALASLALTGAASKPALTCPTCYALSTPRSMHTATLLGNGLVLVTGGQTDKGITASAEIFDPKSGQTRAIGSMHVARAGHSATLLADGRVFIAGGENNNHVTTASFEIFDPKTERFIDTGRLADASSAGGKERVVSPAP